MRLSKAQKASLLVSAFFVIADQISDIWMGLEYHFNCHYQWSMISFILTFGRSLLGGFAENLTCYQDIRSRCSATAYAMYNPIWMVYKVKQIVLNNDDQNVIFDKIASIKMMKLREAIGEASYQLYFNLYTRSYMDSLSPIHLASICLSFLSFLNAFGDAFVCYHGRTLSPRLLDVVKAMIFISIDWLSKFGAFAIGAIVFKFYCVPICTSFAWIILTCVHIYICKGDVKFTEIKYLNLFITDKAFFAVTNIPLGIYYKKSVRHIEIFNSEYKYKEDSDHITAWSHF